jgi:isoleucyl-tRNA synthetase
MESDTRKALPVLMRTHAAIKAAMETAREQKHVGSSLQASVTLVVEKEAALEVLHKNEDELADIFVVSSLDINGSVEEDSTDKWSVVKSFEYGTVVVGPPTKAKCPRCWRYVAPAEDALCGRCDSLVGEAVD